MSREDKKTCACSSCQCRYRVAEALEGKIVCCKKCGAKFKVSFEAAGGQEESAQKVCDNAFDLTVSEDKLEAYICRRGEVPDGISLDSIKELLETKGIKYGIVDDRLIGAYLKKRPIPQEPRQIAQGKIPELPRDGRIKYYFDANPLKVGTLKEGGAIDFKDRGQIPRVEEGAVLAERIPGKEGTPGIDVYGNTIAVPKLKTVELRCGKGTKISGDRLRAFAGLSGRPEISFNGKVVVLPELKISGDVGLETGHVDFDGNIEILGSVQDGFRVTGRRLSADEILKAEIEIAGDIVVIGGIVGARVKSGGNIRATYVRAAEIEALGDVVVDREVIDSKIETNGTCTVKNGKVLSSWVSAKRGVEAQEIGSDASKPCMLVVGLSKSTRSEVDWMEDKIQAKEEEWKKHKSLVDELNEECERLEKEIEKLAQVRKHAMVQQRNIEDKMDELKKAKDQSVLAKAEKLIDGLDAQIKQTEGPLNKLLDRQETIGGRMARFQNEIESCEEEINELRDDIKAIYDALKHERGRPVVKAYQKIFSHTTIRGPHASTILKKDLDQVSIREAKISTSDSDSSFIWDMKIVRL